MLSSVTSTKHKRTNWKKVVLLSSFGLIAVILIGCIFFVITAVVYVNGIDEGIARQKDQSEFFQTIDNQEYYDCCPTFTVEGTSIYENIKGYKRELFKNVKNVKYAFLGPDKQTIHFRTTDEKISSVCINIKSKLPPVTEDDRIAHKEFLKDGNIAQVPPWNFDHIFNNRSDSNFFPPSCGNLTILPLYGKDYQIYITGDISVQPIMHIAETTTQLNVTDINLKGKFKDPAIEKNTWRMNIFRENYYGYVYPDSKYELKDFIMLKFGSRFIALSRSNLTISQELEIPSLMDIAYTDSPGCGGPIVYSSIESNIIALFHSNCEGGDFNSIIDLSQIPAKRTSLQQYKIYAQPYRSPTVTWESGMLILKDPQVVNITDELISQPEIVSVCDNSQGSWDTVNSEYQQKGQLKYPNDTINCSLCGFASGCYRTYSTAEYKYNSTKGLQISTR